MPPKEPENGPPRTAEDPRFRRYAFEYYEKISTELGGFTAKQIKGATRLCEELAIEKIKQEDKADNDPLTDLLNKRGFRKYIDQRLQQYHREIREGSRKPDEIKASILFLDLDHFKLVNDTYDHATGDQVLTTFSELLKDMRPSDIVSRWGGEEFAGFLDGEGGEEAVQVADRLRMETSDLFNKNFPDLNWPKTVSCGVYQLPPLTEEQLASEESRQSLIEQSIHYADVAHYKGAKQAGRNKVGVMVPNGRIYTAVLLSAHGEPAKVQYLVP